MVTAVPQSVCVPGESTVATASRSEQSPSPGVSSSSVVVTTSFPAVKTCAVKVTEPFGVQSSLYEMLPLYVPSCA